MFQSALKTEVAAGPSAFASGGSIAVPDTTITVQEALAAIWQDSHDAPAAFLDDTLVPHGGE